MCMCLCCTCMCLILMWVGVIWLCVKIWREKTVTSVNTHLPSACTCTHKHTCTLPPPPSFTITTLCTISSQEKLVGGLFLFFFYLTGAWTMKILHYFLQGWLFRTNCWVFVYTGAHACENQNQELLYRGKFFYATMS